MQSVNFCVIFEINIDILTLKRPSYNVYTKLVFEKFWETLYEN